MEGVFGTLGVNLNEWGGASTLFTRTMAMNLHFRF